MSITSLQALAGQLHVFRTSPPAVPENSDLYFTDTVNTVGALTHRTLTGMHLVLGANEPGGLYTSLHHSTSAGIDPKSPQVALHQLLIVCDHLVIASPLWLPECDVIIHARKLEIRPGAYLKTEPQAWTREKAANAVDTTSTPRRGEYGANGRKAGDISVWVKEFSGPAAANANEAWFRMVGGKGQDPGEGKDGEPGRSISVEGFPVTEWVIERETHSFPGSSDYKNKWRLKFPPESPALYILVSYSKVGIHLPHLDEEFGHKEWPGHGTDALMSGKPGEPGPAGIFTSNHRFKGREGDSSGAVHVSSRSGKAGSPGRETNGGAAGGPENCAHYTLRLQKELRDGEDMQAFVTEWKDNPNKPMRPGMSYGEMRAVSEGGVDVEPQTVVCSNAWLHPLLLQKALTFFRDAYLAEQFDLLRDRMKVYSEALAQPSPTEFLRSEWSVANLCEWNAGKIEIATMQLRLQNQLDYFGNAPGYMPVWSLQGALQRYLNESEEALRTLLLTRWVARESAEKKNAGEAATAALDLISRKSKQLAEQAKAAEVKLARFHKGMDEVFRSQQKIENDINTMRETLLVKVKGKAQLEAAVQMGLKVASVLCYVIPVGQPFLGAGASVAMDLVEKIAFSDSGGTEIASDALAKTGKEWESAWKEYQKSGEGLTKEAEAAAKDAEAAAKRDKKDFSQKDWEDANEAALKKSTKWGQVAAGTSSALSKLSQGLSALQVPESAINAKLNKALGGEPAFKELSAELERLLEEKKQLSEMLGQGLQEVHGAYAQLATLAANVVSWHRQRASASAALSPALAAFNAQMDQQARISLLAALYEVVKAYETTLFKGPTPPKSFDWKLDVIFDKVTNLLNAPQTMESLLAQAQALKPIFEQNLKNVLKWLSEDYGVGEALNFPLEYKLSDRKLLQLRQEPVVIDAVRKGLVPPDRDRAFLTKVKLLKENIAFSEPLPRSGNAIIRLRPSDQGIVRSGGKLYSVHRTSIKEWVWTYRFSNGILEAAITTEQAKDLMDMMLNSDKLRQQLAAPPAWSDMTLEVSYTGIPDDSIPPITNLVFTCFVDSHPAGRNEVTMELRCDDPELEVKVSPEDSGGMKGGKTEAFGIYTKMTEVELSTASNTEVDWEVPLDSKVCTLQGGVWQDNQGERRTLAKGRTVRVVPAKSVRVVLHKHSRIRCKTRPGWEQHT